MRSSCPSFPHHTRQHRLNQQENTAMNAHINVPDEALVDRALDIHFIHVR
ncbi:MAG: hypothetical protein LLH30_17535 [Candidatus Manganitrophus sp. SA1]|nr:hypothetical protein [Candidatus Manganitrophus morganii]